MILFKIVLCWMVFFRRSRDSLPFENDVAFGCSCQMSPEPWSSAASDQDDTASLDIAEVRPVHLLFKLVLNPRNNGGSLETSSPLRASVHLFQFWALTAAHSRYGILSVRLNSAFLKSVSLANRANIQPCSSSRSDISQNSKNSQYDQSVVGSRRNFVHPELYAPQLFVLKNVHNGHAWRISKNEPRLIRQSSFSWVKHCMLEACITPETSVFKERLKGAWFGFEA